MLRRVLLGLGLIVLVAQSAWIGLDWLRSRKHREQHGHPVAEGARIAERLGCFACHGPGGVEGIPNPGHPTGSVPGWSGGTWMMWNQSEADVRSWILDGRPLERPASGQGLIRMPAYRDRLGPGELQPLTAFVLAVSLFGTPTDPQVAAGRELALRYGCLGCHGPEGRGLHLNPGSFSGWIPGWDGDAFDELVRDRSEFAEWVRDGISARMRANPAARHFLERQVIPMPAYGERIAEDEIDALWAFAGWVRAHPRGADR